MEMQKASKGVFVTPPPLRAKNHFSSPDLIDCYGVMIASIPMLNRAHDHDIASQGVNLAEITFFTPGATLPHN